MKFFEIILKFTNATLNGKLIFTQFLSDDLGPFKFIQHKKITPFFYNIISVSGGGASTPPDAGAHGCLIVNTAIKQLSI